MGKAKDVTKDSNTGKKKKIRPLSPAERWTGHALDGSQQLDIVEEQIYVNEPGTTIDQPLVPPQKPPK
ncbi:hypothetical protein SAMN04515617_12045 [Collimonas sp. OK242]|jgi:hypothetical protein|uniref:hypothetical protein n=1 Tax=Collimonas sp. OK242 TaxID=1798195 RepID=UPI000898060F|nr:hypothetical protein [Collimonas sp. OK242]SDY72324.1 hypothetical protein SAMN04515617_12045 [Collimonas sp. OK242]